MLDPFAELDDLLTPPLTHASPAPALPPAPAPVQPVAPAVPPQAPAPIPAAAPAEAMQAALAAFLEGAGVPNAPTGGDPEAALRAVGQVFRVMTEGLREVLMSRAAIKGEMRVEQTMIRASNNNALKFSVTPEDAVLALLSAGRPGYMPPLTAAREAFDDIKTHELAVMTGVQTALVGLLRRFDPDGLEQHLSQGMLSSLVPAARKARLWDSFRDMYKTIASEAEDDFQAVFGRAFAKAYMAQTRKEQG
jgi:type VI secretion system FHA domain protein